MPPTNPLWPQASAPIELTADDVHVWAVPIDVAGHEQQARRDLLTADERQRAEQFRRQDAAQQFVVSRVALRVLLGRYLDMHAADVRLGREPSGKPTLERSSSASPANELHFNVAHSGQLALIAVATGCEVGVDVEQLRPIRRLEQLAERYFTAGEARAVLSADSTQRAAAFLSCWARKEAVLKAIGTGLGYPLESLKVGAAGDGGWVELPAWNSISSARCWLATVEPATAYVGAVACLDSRRRVVGYTLRFDN